MSHPPIAAVAGLGLFLPEFSSLAAWSADEVSESNKPTGVILDRRTRRRSSQLTRAIADAYSEALSQSQLDATVVDSVFGSALGEASTMIGILDQMWREHEAPSPMAFATSVHNAASGGVSIGTKNRAFTTSLAADFDTPAMSLMEAAGLLLGATSTSEQGAPGVVVVLGDEGAPNKLVDEARGWQMAACALALVPLARATPEMPRISLPFRRSDQELLPPTAQGGVARNPQAGGVDLVCALARRHSGVVALDHGQGGGWAVEIVCTDD